MQKTKRLAPPAPIAVLPAAAMAENQAARAPPEAAAVRYCTSVLLLDLATATIASAWLLAPLHAIAAAQALAVARAGTTNAVWCAWITCDALSRVKVYYYYDLMPSDTYSDI